MTQPHRAASCTWTSLYWTDQADRAGAMTGAIANLTCGALVD
jgi:hypothetical protein